MSNPPDQIKRKTSCHTATESLVIKRCGVQEPLLIHSPYPCSLRRAIRSHPSILLRKMSRFLGSQIRAIVAPSGTSLGDAEVVIPVTFRS
jgi:hypothetical protein